MMILYCIKFINCNCYMKVFLLLLFFIFFGCLYYLLYLFKRFLKLVCFKKVIYNNIFMIIICYIFDSFFINFLFFVRSYIISF